VAGVNGESKISRSHLARAAVVYVRQSTLVQVRDHAESTARQYGLAGVAVGLGWAAEDVVVVDADLGVSGRFGADRDGFRQLVARVCLGEVGAVFGLEVSRLARSSAEFTRLLELARLTDTLLVDGDGVYDLGDVNDRILLGLKGTMSEVELHLLAGRLHGAKLAAAGRGDLRAPLPVGFVYDGEDRVVFDPDEQIRGVVGDLFAEFTRTGSACAVVAAFGKAGRLFPQRAYGGVWAGQLRWGKLTHSRVVQALHNPGYAGAYTYGRSQDVRRVTPDGAVKTLRRKRPRGQWLVVIPDHHEGYISWQQYLDNEAKLAANQTKAGARPPREGTALCQGIVHCGACGARMGTRYRPRRPPIYVCVGWKDNARTPDCRSVIASTVDEAVARLLLATVTGEQISLALAAADEVAERHTRSHRAAELAVERARYDADRAERAFTLVEPSNRLVARTLEQRWETRLAALAQAEAALITAHAAKPPLPDRDSLTALAADLPRLFNDPATSPRDRKRLLRTLIADITVLPDPDSTTCRIGIRWHTGATDEITLDRAGPGRTPQAALDRIRAHGATKTSTVLAAELNAAGLRTGKGHPFTAAAVARIRDTYTIRAPRTVPLHDGEISVQRAAAELGITADAITNWLRNGQAPARKGASGRWCIPWDPATQALYRQKVAESFRLKPTQPTTAGGAV
jgi:DNA invertase Pin-like site-specific DNA recombinase